MITLIIISIVITIIDLYFNIKLLRENIRIQKKRENKEYLEIAEINDIGFNIAMILTSFVPIFNIVIFIAVGIVEILSIKV